MAFVPDAPPKKFVPDAAPQATVSPPVTNPSVGGKETTEGPLGFANGLAELVGKGLGNLPMAAVHGIAEILSRGTGRGGIKPSAPSFPLSPNAQSVGTGISDTLGAAAAPYQNPMVDTMLNSDFVKNYVAPVAGDVGAVLPFAGGAGRVAGAIGDALGPSEAAAAEAASLSGQLGLRTTKPHPVASTIAGPTAAPTLDAQNQAAATTVLGADAGVPHGVPVNATSLEAARVKPGTLLDQGAELLPTAPLSSAAQAKVLAARGPSTITKPTPNVEAQINDIESRLTDPDAQHTGAAIRATRNSLSSDANAGMNSADADTRAIAKYKRGIVDALDQHVEDTMPAGSAISPAMLQNARATLAKNYGLQDAIGKGGDINLQQLAKDHRDNPHKYTGNSRTVLQFASDHPEVTGGISDTDRIAPHGLLKDVADTNLISRPIGSIAQIFGGRFARRALTGAPGESLTAAQKAPVAGLAGEFEPKTPSEPPAAPSEPSAPSSPETAPLLSGNTYGGQPPLSNAFSNNASGQTAVSDEFANAQASDQAARVKRSIIDPDGNGTPVSGVAARDLGIQGSTAGAKVPKGHLAIEEKPGEAPRILDRGGLSQSAANGLLNRHIALRTSLGDSYP